MTSRCVVGVIVAALALGACSSYGNGPAEYAVTNDTGVGATSGTGASDSTAGSRQKAGSGGATTPAPSGPGEKKDQRGNTPPGVSRDGQGPLGGAIVDPTGAVTKTPPPKGY